MKSEPQTELVLALLPDKVVRLLCCFSASSMRSDVIEAEINTAVKEHKLHVLAHRSDGGSNNMAITRNSELEKNHALCHMHFEALLNKDLEPFEDAFTKALSKLVTEILPWLEFCERGPFMENPCKMKAAKMIKKISSILTNLRAMRARPFDRSVVLSNYSIIQSIQLNLEKIKGRCAVYATESLDYWNRICQSIKTFLNENKDMVIKVAEMRQFFNCVRSTLVGQGLSRTESEEKMNLLFNQIKPYYESKMNQLIAEKEAKRKTRNSKGKDAEIHPRLPKFKPSADLAPTDIYIEWYRTYLEYRNGLFVYKSFPWMERTNNQLEQLISQFNTYVRRRQGIYHVSDQLETYADLLFPFLLDHQPSVYNKNPWVEIYEILQRVTRDRRKQARVYLQRKRIPIHLRHWSLKKISNEIDAISKEL